MTVSLNSMKVDLARVRGGVDIESAEIPGVTFTVRGFNYPPYQAARSLQERRWLKKYGQNPVPLDELYQGNGRLYAEFILLGWKGMDQEYTPELALETLTTPGFDIMHDAVRECGMRAQQVDIEFVENARGN